MPHKSQTVCHPSAVTAAVYGVPHPFSVLLCACGAAVLYYRASVCSYYFISLIYAYFTLPCDNKFLLFMKLFRLLENYVVTDLVFVLFYMHIEHCAVWWHVEK